MCEPALEPDCTSTCRPNYCGDGVVSTQLDEARRPLEACDDGNNVDGDDCRYDCRQDFTLCGNGRLDAGEECDAGRSNSLLPDACRLDCRVARCGDGVVDSGEACDGTPGCGSDCTRMLR
jgi:cysteine-rich repeat protein